MNGKYGVVNGIEIISVIYDYAEISRGIISLKLGQIKTFP
jgi:hypothetical protein